MKNERNCMKTSVSKGEVSSLAAQGVDWEAGLGEAVEARDDTDYPADSRAIAHGQLEEPEHQTVPGRKASGAEIASESEPTVKCYGWPL
jgi:hypothetical protein